MFRQNKTCRYYLQGCCRFGEQCHFSHDAGDDDYPIQTRDQHYNSDDQHYNSREQKQYSQPKSLTTPKPIFSGDFEKMTVEEFADLMSDDLNKHIFQGAMYPFTAYGYASFIMPGLEDKSLEEARYEYRMAESSKDPKILTQHLQEVEDYTKKRLELLVDLLENVDSRPFLENLQSELRDCQDEYHKDKTRTTSLSKKENSEPNSYFGKGNAHSRLDVFGGSTGGASDKAASIFAGSKDSPDKISSSSFSANSDKTNSTAAAVFAVAKTEQAASTSNAANFFTEAKALQNSSDITSKPAPVTQSSNSRKSLFGKPIGNSVQVTEGGAAKDLFASAVRAEKNEPKTLFGKPIMEKENKSGNAFNNPKQSLFEKSAAANVDNSSRSSFFGKKAPEKSNTTKALFGKGTTNDAVKSSEMDKYYYSNEEQLSTADLKAFKAEKFILGNIPYVLPPKVLCV